MMQKYAIIYFRLMGQQQATFKNVQRQILDVSGLMSYKRGNLLQDLFRVLEPNKAIPCDFRKKDNRAQFEG